MSYRIWVRRTAALLVGGAMACGSSTPLPPPPPPPPIEQCPAFERDPLREPDLMAWDATERQKVQEKRSDGVVALRMEQQGCMVTARVVDCVGQVAGAASGSPYQFKPYPRSDTLVADSQREAYAKLPLNAASLGGEFGAGRSLRVDYRMVGAYVLPDGVTVGEWKGTDCEQATHYATRVIVGGFARASGQRDAVKGDVGVFGVGAGAGQRQSELRWSTEGNPADCEQAMSKKEESAGCNVPLRLELRAIPGREVETEAPATPSATAQAAPEQPTAPRPAAPDQPAPEQPAPPRPAATAPPAPAQTTATSCPGGMAWIGGGTFQMGSNNGDDDEKPVHTQEVSGFCLDVTEVTVRAYKACSTCSAPSTGRSCNWGVSGRDQHPINCVDWDQAQAYCAAVGKRLPTEAEWEYAARGGSQQLTYPWGSAAPGRLACWDGEGNDLGRGNRQGTCPVASYPAGAFGLRDMAGNVWEWVADWYGPYPQRASKNYAGPSSGTGRVRRGGSWLFDSPSLLRGASRNGLTPAGRGVSLGLRCARTR